MSVTLYTVSRPTEIHNALEPAGCQRELQRIRAGQSSARDAWMSDTYHLDHSQLGDANIMEDSNWNYLARH